MLGKHLFSIEAKDLVKGMSTSDDAPDGGFSSLTSSVQLTYDPGIAYQIAGATNKSTNLVGTMIASSEDPSSNSFSRLFVSSDSNQDGRFFTIDSAGTLTARGSADTSHNYIEGRTDIIGFQGEAYITTATGGSNGNLRRWILPATFSDLMDFTFGNAPHPALNFEGFAYYGDGNQLWRQATAGVAPSVILTLANVSDVITALGIDPGSGKMLISTTSEYNISDTLNAVTKVLYYDGFSNKVLKSIIVDEMVESFFPVASTMLVGYGQKIGVWNGAGIRFLRKLDVPLDNNFLPYKHKWAKIGSTAYIGENGKVLAYGPVLSGGRSVFYYAWENSSLTSTNPLTNIANIGNNLLSLSFLNLTSTASFYTWDSSAIGTGGQSFYSNNYNLDRPYWIRRIRVVYKTSVINNNSTFPQLALYDESGLITSLGTAGFIFLGNTTGDVEYYHWIENINVKVNLLQIEALMAVYNPGIRRIVVYAEPADIE